MSKESLLTPERNLNLLAPLSRTVYDYVTGLLGQTAIEIAYQITSLSKSKPLPHEQVIIDFLKEKLGENADVGYQTQEFVRIHTDKNGIVRTNSTLPDIFIVIKNGMDKKISVELTETPFNRNGANAEDIKEKQRAIMQMFVAPLLPTPNSDASNPLTTATIRVKMAADAEHAMTTVEMPKQPSLNGKSEINSVNTTRSPIAYKVLYLPSLEAIRYVNSLPFIGKQGNNEHRFNHKRKNI